MAADILTKPKCASPECDRVSNRVGLCYSHYGRLKRGGDISTPIRLKRSVAGVLERSESGQKFCTKCSLWKSPEGFYKMARSVDGLMPYCKDCDRKELVLRKYGLTPQNYADILTAQNHACAICGVASESDGIEWAIDHDHNCCPDGGSCGQCVRGILCRSCNVGLGYFRDNMQTLLSAANYLKESV